ncbi:GNAT family N-acetyltransferase [Actinokineospora sp. HUAS TT18]|uniref:GNAT family N-acetyltransferase n=1 Tax=Actinokineospora sp. HUAS TT18 TaxID=3447451 RepID=UPI003F5234B7
MRVVSYPFDAVPAELRDQVTELWVEAWQDPSGHDPVLGPVSMLLIDGETVHAALDILGKEIVHAGERYVAGGLSTVVTRKTSRGQGHGKQLVAAARAAMSRGFDLGLFTCDRPLVPFYESAGWRALPGTVLVGGTPSAPFPSDRPGFDKVTMAEFFSPRVDQAAFANARIELYPGEIDKLW